MLQKLVRMMLSSVSTVWKAFSIFFKGTRRAMLHGEVEIEIGMLAQGVGGRHVVIALHSQLSRVRKTTWILRLHNEMKVEGRGL